MVLGNNKSPDSNVHLRKNNLKSFKSTMDKKKKYRNICSRNRIIVSKKKSFANNTILIVLKNNVGPTYSCLSIFKETSIVSV